MISRLRVLIACTFLAQVNSFAIYDGTNGTSNPSSRAGPSTQRDNKGGTSFGLVVSTLSVGPSWNETISNGTATTVSGVPNTVRNSSQLTGETTSALSESQQPTTTLETTEFESSGISSSESLGLSHTQSTTHFESTSGAEDVSTLLTTSVSQSTSEAQDTPTPGFPGSQTDSGSILTSESLSGNPSSSIQETSSDMGSTSASQSTSSFQITSGSPIPSDLEGTSELSSGAQSQPGTQISTGSPGITDQATRVEILTAASLTTPVTFDVTTLSQYTDLETTLSTTTTDEDGKPTGIIIGPGGLSWRCVICLGGGGGLKFHLPGLPDPIPFPQFPPAPPPGPGGEEPGESPSPTAEPTEDTSSSDSCTKSASATDCSVICSSVSSTETCSSTCHRTVTGCSATGTTITTTESPSSTAASGGPVYVDVLAYDDPEAVDAISDAILESEASTDNAPSTLETRASSSISLESTTGPTSSVLATSTAMPDSSNPPSNTGLSSSTSPSQTTPTESSTEVTRSFSLADPAQSCSLNVQYFNDEEGGYFCTCDDGVEWWAELKDDEYSCVQEITS
ncbi:MAG: hypothetical protein M1837_003310 [Sclerophora amabilis]|nr:MAG: hypothetical protein M1837_003310 [Sclerophora amabilis]